MFHKVLSHIAFFFTNLELIRAFANEIKERYHGDSPMANASEVNGATIQDAVERHPELAAAAAKLDGPGIARSTASGAFADLFRFILDNPALFLSLLDRFFGPADGDGEDDNLEPGEDKVNDGGDGDGDDEPSTDA